MANSASAHEDAHVRQSLFSDKINVEEAPITWFNGNADPYEASSRGTELKNFFGIGKGSNSTITPEMLEYARANYVRLTGADTMMQDFLNSITDFQEAAKWISKYSYANGGSLGWHGKPLYGPAWFDGKKMYGF